MEYRPFVIGADALAALRSPEYRSFLEESVLASGLRLLAARRARHPDYPFPDTKFNPNTGEDYPESQYDVVFTWFLGRGGEACSAHLGVLEALRLPDAERAELRAMLERYVRNQNEAILAILAENRGRVPFRVNRALRGIDAQGRPVELAPERCNASELFCAKALVAGGRPEEVAAGAELFRRFIERAFANGYEDDTASYDRTLHAESPFMLAMGAIAHLVRATGSVAEWGALTARVLDYELDTFFEAESGRFFELVDFTTKRRLPWFLPGHASELVGLALQAIDSIESARAALAAPVARSLERAKRELPRLLAGAFELGYDAVHRGVRQEVDARTGEPRSTDLPWWSLPETMRAAARGLLVATNDAARARCADIFRTTSNDYFACYPNPKLLLFPFRTRSGETGDVKNLMPVVPEADPLYHTNLAVIDTIDVISRLR